MNVFFKLLRMPGRVILWSLLWKLACKPPCSLKFITLCQKGPEFWLQPVGLWLRDPRQVIFPSRSSAWCVVVTPVLPNVSQLMARFTRIRDVKMLCQLAGHCLGETLAFFPPGDTNEAHLSASPGVPKVATRMTASTALWTGPAHQPGINYSEPEKPQRFRSLIPHAVSSPAPEVRVPPPLHSVCQ